MERSRRPPDAGITRSALGLGVALIAVLALSSCTPQRGEPAGSDDFVDVPGIGSTRIDVPRPTGVGSAACDADPLPPESDATIADRVIDLREIGLFADRAETTEAALAASVEEAVTDTWGAIPDVPAGILDLVAEQDRHRVWWRDLEADVIDGNEVYAQTISELGEISVGAFEPTAIVESWQASEGPVTVEFVAGGATHTLFPAYLDDWIDPGILVGINEVIVDTGRTFEMYEAFDQTAFVMALTDAERGGTRGARLVLRVVAPSPARNVTTPRARCPGRRLGVGRGV